MAVEDQAARLAREPSIMTLVKVEDVWINPRHVVRLWWTPPDDKSTDGYTVVRMSDGHLVTVHTPLDEVAATING